MTVLKIVESNFYDNAASFIEETNKYYEYKLATGRNYSAKWEDYEEVLDPFESDEELIKDVLDISGGSWVVEYNKEEDGFNVYKVELESPIQVIAEALLEKEKAGSICPQLKRDLEKIKVGIYNRR